MIREGLKEIYIFTWGRQSGAEIILVEAAPPLPARKATTKVINRKEFTVHSQPPIINGSSVSFNLIIPTLKRKIHL